MNSIMIHWEEKRIFCNVCGEWIQHDKIWIDGTHDFLNGKRSTHTIWEKP